MEHYVTLFDHKFLPQGLALHASLQKHAAPFQLWVICMDALALEQLRRLNLPDLRPVALAEVEDDELRAAKAGRSWTEYCWTLTPAVCLHLLETRPECQRVTYVDADLLFFRSPRPLFEELERSGKPILITEHAHAPNYAHVTALAGRFCVQFLVFTRDSRTTPVLRQWRAQCLASCTAVATPGTPGFGDQKYLEAWPEQFGASVHILAQTRETLAPWNVDHFQQEAGKSYSPVFFHFHGFRILSPKLVRLSSTYRVRQADHLYGEYLAVLDGQVEKMRAADIPLPVIPPQSERWWRLRMVKRLLFQHLKLRRHSFPAGPAETTR
jgi:hypothetical protein